MNTASGHAPATPAGADYPAIRTDQDWFTRPDARKSGKTPAVGCHVRVSAWCLPTATAARRARNLLRSQLSEHIAHPAVLDDLDLIVCELATNAYRHTDGPCEMRLVRHGGAPVACEIADAGDGLEQVAQHLHHHARQANEASNVDQVADAGRGLMIVALLTGGRCGVRATRLCGTGQLGKSVWFAIPSEASTANRTCR